MLNIFHRWSRSNKHPLQQALESMGAETSAGTDGTLNASVPHSELGALLLDLQEAQAKMATSGFSASCSRRGAYAVVSFGGVSYVS